MKRRVFAGPEGGQVLATYVPETDVIEVAIRPDSWSRWSPPLAIVGTDDDPPEGRLRSDRYVERAVEAMAPKSLGDAMRAIGRYTESEGGDSAETQQARAFLFDLYTAWVDVGRPELSG